MKKRFLNSLTLTTDGLRNTGVAPIHGYRNEMNFVAGTAIACPGRPLTNKPWDDTAFSPLAWPM